MHKITGVAAAAALAVTVAGCSATNADTPARTAAEGWPGRAVASAQSRPGEPTGLSGLGQAIPSGEPAIGRPRAPASQLGLPLDAYALTQAQLVRLTTAENLAAHVCLRRLGFDLPERAFSPVVTARDVPRYELRFLSPAAASRWGYGGPGAPPHGLPAPAALPSGTRATQLAATLAFYGETTRLNGRPVPAGGCHGWGLRAILSPAQPVNPLNMIYQSETYTLSDPRMLADFGGWSSCMAARGFRFPSPLAAEEGPTPHAGWPTRPDAQELATAAADARCRQRTGLEGTWVSLMTAYEREFLSRNGTELARARQASDQWLRHAATYGA